MENTVANSEYLPFWMWPYFSWNIWFEFLFIVLIFNILELIFEVSI